MKKSKMLLLVFIALLTLSANTLAATVSMPAMSGDAGTAIDIPVNIDDAAGLAGYQFTVTYNPSVLDCTTASNGSLTGAWDEPNVTAVMSNKIVTVTIDPNLAELGGGNGSLALIRCTVVGRGGATTPLHFVQNDATALSNSDAAPVPATYVDGSFTINGVCTPAEELCDGIDNDCDGLVDENVQGCTRPITLTTCSASLGFYNFSKPTTLMLRLPIMEFYGLGYEVDFVYIDGTLDFDMDFASIKVVSDMGLFIGCSPSTLSDALGIHVPSLSFSDIGDPVTLYWMDMQYTVGMAGATFTLTNLGL